MPSQTRTTAPSSLEGLHHLVLLYSESVSFPDLISLTSFWSTCWLDGSIAAKTETVFSPSLDDQGTEISNSIDLNQISISTLSLNGY